MNTTRRAALLMMVAATACSLKERRSGAIANPPLWKVSRGAACVSLFGQIPLPDRVHWYGSQLQRAFETADEVWFENPPFDASAAIAIRDRVALGGPRLGEVIGGVDRLRLSEALRAAGKPENTFDDELAWQAYLSISDLIDALNGVSPTNIPERKLRALAVERGKRIKSEWASMREIMDFSKAQTVNQQLDLISKTLDGLRTKSEVRRHALEWSCGDLTAAISAHERMQAKYPQLTATLVAERNMRWIGRVENMLRETRSTFVCVGLGHLIGEQSIQVLAAESGFAVSSV